MRTKAFFIIIIACISLSACTKTKEAVETSPHSVYFSHDLQMETLKGKVNRVDYEFYKDRDCYQRYSRKTPYNLVYDEKGNLLSDSRYRYFGTSIERDENGFFTHVNASNVVSEDEFGEWDMYELSYTYDKEGFMETSFKAGMGDDCGGRTYLYVDSLPSRIMVEAGGSIDYEILKTDNHGNWTLAKVLANYCFEDGDGSIYRVKDRYYIKRIIMYNFDDSDWSYSQD